MMKILLSTNINSSERYDDLTKGYYTYLFNMVYSIVLYYSLSLSLSLFIALSVIVQQLSLSLSLSIYIYVIYL